MERPDPRSREDAYGRRINRTHSPLLAYFVPFFTILLGSLIPLPIMASAMPLVPPLAFIILLAWRMLRPGLIPVWAGFPLGLFDDLFSGNPFGSAILLFSIALLVLEILETRFPWRSFIQDWFTASLAIALYLLTSALLSGAQINLNLIVALGPQLLFSILLFPLVARMIARLDRLRLLRFRTIA